jgi:hypothetical protein
MLDCQHIGVKWLIAGETMIQTTAINADLIETLTQIIYSLNDQDRQLLMLQLQDPNPMDTESLQQKIESAAEQLRNNDCTEYTDETLPDLKAKIRSRGLSRLNQV